MLSPWDGLEVIWVAQVVHLFPQKLFHLISCFPALLFPKCHSVFFTPLANPSHYPASWADLLNTSLKKICSAHLLSMLFACQQVLCFPLLCAVLSVLNICQSPTFTLWCSFLMLLLLTVSSTLYTAACYSIYLYMEFFVLVYLGAWMLSQGITPYSNISAAIVFQYIFINMMLSLCSCQKIFGWTFL